MVIPAAPAPVIHIVAPNAEPDPFLTSLVEAIGAAEVRVSSASQLEDAADGASTNTADLIIFDRLFKSLRDTYI